MAQNAPNAVLRYRPEMLPRREPRSDLKFGQNPVCHPPSQNITQQVATGVNDARPISPYPQLNATKVAAAPSRRVLMPITFEMSYRCVAANTAENGKSELQRS